MSEREALYEIMRVASCLTRGPTRTAIEDVASAQLRLSTHPETGEPE